MSNVDNDIDRHRATMDSLIERQRRTFVDAIEEALIVQGYKSKTTDAAEAKARDIARPTWGFLASPITDVSLLAHRLSANGLNVTIMHGLGAWNGTVEQVAHILYQGDGPEDVLSVLARYPRLRWVHVLADGATVDYFDLDTIRKGKV